MSAVRGWRGCLEPPRQAGCSRSAGCGCSAGRQCLCASAGGLSGAVLTLLREGHFAVCLKKSGYLDTVHDAVLTPAVSTLLPWGTTADPLANAITHDAVYAGVMHRADSLWHGSTNDETDPFGSLITTYQDTVAPEPPTFTMATAFYSITAKWSGRVRWQRRFRRR